MTTDKNLWENDKKQLFRELYHQYIEEGYNQKEAKRMARQEAEEIYSDSIEFAFTVSEQEFDQ
jgi:UTP:GlnB (protein PII) uridylyltransferase